MSAEATVAEDALSASPNGTATRRAGRQIASVLVAFAAFGLYWLSALVLESRDATLSFGADTWVYADLAKGNVIDRIGSDYLHDRIIRFHPLTTALAAAWMKILSPLTHWISPQDLLKAMFAAVGALGVWAATWAFAAVVPRRYVVLLGAIYATSLGVWHFSSIEESKIVSATLTALYIATYLHLRNRWTLRGAVLLTAILLLACLNEIVAGFLVIIPTVDTLLQRGWDLRHGRWIGWHGLAAPLALVFLEVVIKGRLVGRGTDAENASHFSMLIYYVTRNDLSAASLHSFLVNWLFFNIAAPSVEVSQALPIQPDYKAYFEPALANYFSSPVSAALVVVFGVMLVASLLPWYRAERLQNGMAGLLLALLAYALLRGVFFFIVHPNEGLLFSSGATLAHMLLISVPFTASTLPATRGLLAGFAVLLFITNGTFIIGR